MKKFCSLFLAVYFLIGSLSPKMDFQQLLHLGNAIEHYALHQAEATNSGTTFTFLDFMMDHYLDPNNHEHEEGDEHDELPFTHTHSSTIDYVEIYNIVTDFSTPEDKHLEQKFMTVPVLYSSDFTPGLYQPPASA